MSTGFNDGALTVDDAATSRADLGLGTISTQNANNIDITGGTMDGVVIGGSTPAAATVTTLTATGNVNLEGAANQVGTITSGTWNGSLIGGTYGGTGVNNGASTFTYGGNVTFSGAHTFSGTLSNNTSVTFPTSGTLATTSQLPTPAALTSSNDTNVTITLGGTPATALLQAASLTMGWSGQLGVSRGGTGVGTLTGLLTGNGTSAITATAITQYNVLTGGASNAPNSVAPSSTSGVPLISQGASSQPIFGTALVAGGGTGLTTTTAYGLMAAGTTATGNFQNAGTGSSGQLYISGGSSSLGSWTTVTYPSVLFTQASAVTVASTATQTTLLTSGTGSSTLAANFFVANRTVRFTAWGLMSCASGPTFTVQIKYGGGTPGNSGAQTLPSTLSNVCFKIEGVIGCITTGSSGTIWLQGRMAFTSAQAGAIYSIDFGNSATQTVNTTTSTALDIQIKWGTSSSSNTITCTNVVYEQLN